MNNMLWMLLIPLVGLAIFMFIKSRKKKGASGPSPTNQAASKSEVWTVIKQKLKGDGEIGKEIIDSFVQRRPGKEFKKRDVYVVIFTTRDTKTLEIAKPRALEVEIKSVKISRKNTDRRIVINGYKDYEKENAWISELRKKEIAKKTKEAAKLQKKLAKKEARNKTKIIKNVSTNTKNN